MKTILWCDMLRTCEQSRVFSVKKERESHISHKP